MEASHGLRSVALITTYIQADTRDARAYVVAWSWMLAPPQMVFLADLSDHDTVEMDPHQRLWRDVGGGHF
jgi:hypothetical protein